MFVGLVKLVVRQWYQFCRYSEISNQTRYQFFR